MLTNLLYELRRMWPALVVIGLALVVFGDGAQLAVQLYTLSMAVLVLIVAHLLRKSLFNYADGSELVAKAKESPTGSAIVFASIVALIIAVLFAATAHGAEIPERARPHLPALAGALDTHWPGAPLRFVPGGQVEQESGWKTMAKLQTRRELGRGLAQLTIAYNADGSERFNAYRDALAQYPALRDWDWQADPYSVRHALTYVVLRDRAEWTAMRKLMADDEQSWRAALVCYNAGRGRVLKRRALALASGLPADRWTGGLEQAHGPGEDHILYGKPLWQAVNHYPATVMAKAEKYRGAL